MILVKVINTIQGNKKGQIMVYYNEIYYDSAYGVMEYYACKKEIIYLEINVE